VEIIMLIFFKKFNDIRQTDVGTIGSRVGSDLSSLEDVAPRILGYELG
jgi:hypothetical protein